MPYDLIWELIKDTPGLIFKTKECRAHACIACDACPVPTEKTRSQMLRKMFRPKHFKYKVWGRDNYRCVWCRRWGSKDRRPLDLDHLIPLSRGGQNVIENLVTSCKECNQQRGDMMPNDPKWVRAYRKMRRNLKRRYGSPPAPSRRRR